MTDDLRCIKLCGWCGHAFAALRPREALCDRCGGLHHAGRMVVFCAGVCLAIAVVRAWGLP